MKGLGSLLMLIGVATIVLHFMDREYTWLSWIGNWGDGAAWGIRAGMIVVGGILFMMGKSQSARRQQNR